MKYISNHIIYHRDVKATRPVPVVSVPLEKHNQQKQNLPLSLCLSPCNVSYIVIYAYRICICVYMIYHT